MPRQGQRPNIDLSWLPQLLQAADISKTTANPAFGASAADMADEESRNAIYGGRIPTAEQLKFSTAMPYAGGRDAAIRNTEYAVRQAEAGSQLQRQLQLAKQTANMQHVLNVLGQQNLIDPEIAGSRPELSPIATGLYKNWTTANQNKNAELGYNTAKFSGATPFASQVGATGAQKEIAGNKSSIATSGYQQTKAEQDQEDLVQTRRFTLPTAVTTAQTANDRANIENARTGNMADAANLATQLGIDTAALGNQLKQVQSPFSSAVPINAPAMGIGNRVVLNPSISEQINSRIEPESAVVDPSTGQVIMKKGGGAKMPRFIGVAPDGTPIFINQ